jgi:hypothetical protein
MKHRHTLVLCVLITIPLLVSLACLSGRSSGGGSTEPVGVIRQWASNADASTSFGSDDWSAQQATGAPNTTACGDSPTAWASQAYDGMDWLDAGFATPVVPTQINIYESYTPGSIIRVEVRDTDGSYHTVWEGTPASVSTCPRTFVINITDIDYKVTSVLISVDQSVLGDWDEIDAVELVGRP